MEARLLDEAAQSKREYGHSGFSCFLQITLIIPGQRTRRWSSRFTSLALDIECHY